MLSIDDKVGMAEAHMEALRDEREWFSPTEIGIAVGGPYKHSAYGSPICKTMVFRGICERNERGHYKLITE